MNRNMDMRIYQAHGCDALNTSQEAEGNSQMFTPIIKKEIVESFDEDESNCYNHMFRYKPIHSSNSDNNHDSQFCVSIEVKKEFPEDECPQSSTLASCLNKYSRDSKINEELPRVVGAQDIKREASEETFSLVKIEEIHDKTNRFIPKTEITEEHRVLGNAGDRSMLYEVLITPQEIQPNICSGISNSRCNSSTHNNEHIKVEPPKSGDNVMNKFHKCQHCDEYFNNVNMLVHIRDVHSNNISKSKLYPKGTKPYPNGRNGEEMTHKCDSCERIYKSKGALVIHKKKIHYDYGKTFDCWCGKQFLTPINLYHHKYRRHGVTSKIKKNVKFECDYCHKIFITKESLVKHITTIHYDYGKTFVCWCGKQFRTPIHLYRHKNRQHGGKVKKTNNATSKTEFQCDICNNVFKSKRGLIIHITCTHYDYGKTFDCWCGKQFRTPFYLHQHKYKQHGFRLRAKSNLKFQCGSCHNVFKTKEAFLNHITSINYDYDRIYKCWCGEQYPSLTYLYRHKNELHGAQVNGTTNATLKTDFQCDYCKIFLEGRDILISHISNIHQNNGEVFVCRCRKEFHILEDLRAHVREQHNCKSYYDNRNKFKCEYCDSVFKVKRYLAYHVKRMHK